MNIRTLTVLILLNVALLAALVVTFTPQPAQAQLGGGGNQYLLISGQVQGRNQQAGVYVLNVNTGRIVAMMYNSSNDTVEIIDGRDISQDLRNAGRGSR